MAGGFVSTLLTPNPNHILLAHYINFNVSLILLNSLILQIASFAMGNSLKPQNKTQDVLLSEKANIAWSTIFAIVAIVTVAGNSLTIAAFTTKRLVRRRTHFFLISLALADMMVGVVAIPLYIYLSYQTAGLQKGAVDHVFEAADILSGLASVFTLGMISTERLFAIGWPLAHRILRKRIYFGFIGLAWFSAFIISMINLLYRYKIVPYFATLDIVLTALLTSFVITCAAYIALWIKVRFRDLNGVGREQDKKLAKTLSLVTGVFVLTWLPFQTLLFVVHFCFACAIPPQNAVNLIKLLQYCNSFMNPIIYSLRMPDFRKAVCNLFNRGYNLINIDVSLKNLRGETLNTFNGILGSYSSLNLRLCMGTENILSSELNSSTFRRKIFGRNSSSNNSSRRAYARVSVV